MLRNTVLALLAWTLMSAGAAADGISLPGLTIDEHGIRAPGVTIDDEGITAPGVTVEQHRVTAPGVTIDHLSGIQTQGIQPGSPGRRHRVHIRTRRQ
jgi:hypothetical protein